MRNEGNHPMSIETTCKKCGEEYDLRHGECPVCTVTIEMRSSRPPYDTREVKGYLPFEVHGERFAVTRIPCALTDEKQWRATHIETGAGVPGSDCAKMEDVPALLRTMAAKSNPEKLRAAVAKCREIIAEGKLPA